MDDQQYFCFIFLFNILLQIVFTMLLYDFSLYIFDMLKRLADFRVNTTIQALFIC